MQLSAIADSSFEAASRAVVRQSTSLSHHVVPLFSADRRGRHEPRGTGLLVSSGRSSFLVSAAHVLDHAQHLFFPIEPRVNRWLSGELRLTKIPGKIRGNDRLDIGVLKLEGTGLPPYPKVDKSALPVDAFLASALPRENKVYLVLGFPASKSRFHPARQDVTSQHYAFWNVSVPPQKYAEIGVSPDTHIAISFERKNGSGLDGKVRAFPEPAGMSGSPVFMLCDATAPNYLTRAPVVGIFIEYRRPQHAMIATDIGLVLSMISESC